MFYFLVYAGLLLCGLVSRRSGSLRNAFYYICLIGLFFFVGFRYEVGCDWSGYLHIFNMEGSAMEETWLHSNEAAFWAAIKLLHYFELEYPYINVISSGLFFIGFHALAKRQPDRLGVLILAFPILILNLAMSGIRQASAVGFICFAYNAFVDARLVRYVLFVTIAASFHTSALIFLVLAPVVRGEYSRLRVALGALVALPGIYYIMSSGGFELYATRYVGTQVEAAGALFRTGLLALSGVAFLWFLDRKWKAQSIRDYKLVKLLSYMMVATLPLSLFSSVAGDRIGYYLYPIELMILARLPVLVPAQYTTIIAFAPYAAEALLLLVWIWLSAIFAVCYVPYRMWW